MKDSAVMSFFNVETLLVSCIISYNHIKPEIKRHLGSMCCMLLIMHKS